MTVATPTASGGDAGAGFLAQQRETRPARKNTETLAVERPTFRGCRIRDAGISASDVVRRKLSPDRSPAARRLCAHPLHGLGLRVGGAPFFPGVGVKVIRGDVLDSQGVFRSRTP